MLWSALKFFVMPCPRGRSDITTRILGVGLLLFAGFVSEVSGQLPGVELRSVAEIRQLSLEDADRDLRVDFQGVVAARLRVRKRLYVVDGSAVLPLIVSGTNSNFEVGQRVQVRGKTAVINGTINCLVTDILPIGPPGLIPPGEPISIRELHDQDLVYRWVKVEGMVQSAVMRPRNRMGVTLRERGRTFYVTSRQLPDTTPDDLRYGTLEATGLVVPSEGGATAGSPILWADGSNLKITKNPPRNPFTRAQQPIAELLEYRESNRLPARLINVRARVVEAAPNGGLWIDDGTGRMRFMARSSLWLRAGDWIDAIGFLAREEEKIVMDSGTAQIIAPRFDGAQSSRAGRWSGDQPSGEHSHNHRSSQVG